MQVITPLPVSGAQLATPINMSVIGMISLQQKHSKWWYTSGKCCRIIIEVLSQPLIQCNFLLKDEQREEVKIKPQTFIIILCESLCYLSHIIISQKNLHKYIAFEFAIRFCNSADDNKCDNSLKSSVEIACNWRKKHTITLVVP